MVAQTAAVLVLILEPALPAWGHRVGLGLLVTATGLALVSGWQYASAYRRMLGSPSTP
jgi:phosphatidylglycerophosphate synthase